MSIFAKVNPLVEAKEKLVSSNKELQRLLDLLAEWEKKNASNRVAIDANNAQAEKA